MKIEFKNETEIDFCCSVSEFVCDYLCNNNKCPNQIYENYEGGCDYCTSQHLKYISDWLGE